MRRPEKSILQRTLVAGLLWLATSLPVHAQGTIRYVPNVNLDYQLGDTPWDVNGDGNAEFNFYWDRRTFSLMPQAGNQLLTYPISPPEIGADLLPLLASSEIGAFDYSPFQWSGSLDPSGFPGVAYLNSCINLGCGGSFYSTRAYFGFSFELEGQTHYGWGLFNASAGAGGYLESYAYNLDPGVSIFVGQVPEPGTWALLVLGGGLLGLKFRRKSR